jgi:RNA polymerase sigma-70 factor, ECF subfamily
MTRMTTIAAEDLNQRLAGDLSEAFPDLVRSLQDGVYSGALQLTRNSHDAQDVTQDTFVRAYRALDGYEPERIRDIDLRPWIWTIALNVCRNRARSRARKPEIAGIELDDAAPDDPSVEALEAIALETWRARLARLTGPQRTAVVLHHVVGLPYDEIAAITGRNQNTIRTDVRRGLAALRAIIEEDA